MQTPFTVVIAVNAATSDYGAYTEHVTPERKREFLIEYGGIAYQSSPDDEIAEEYQTMVVLQIADKVDANTEHDIYVDFAQDARDTVTAFGEGPEPTEEEAAAALAEVHALWERAMNHEFGKIG